ncbi:hypothetical protein H4582DRAFT_2061036 [Lactarius indigo]|nr:hypothetical protein H4582DRAFT_2061036 [Lactarius indigo]
MPIIGLGGGGIVARMYLNLQSETVGFGRREAMLPVVQAFAGIATSHRESPRSGTRRTTIVKGARECGALEKAQKVTAELVTSYSGRPIRGKRRSKVPKGARGCGTRESAASEEVDSREQPSEVAKRKERNGPMPELGRSAGKSVHQVGQCPRLAEARESTEMRKISNLPGQPRAGCITTVSSPGLPTSPSQLPPNLPRPAI